MLPFKDGPKSRVLTPDSIPQLIGQEPAIAVGVFLHSAWRCFPQHSLPIGTRYGPLT